MKNLTDDEWFNQSKEMFIYKANTLYTKIKPLLNDYMNKTVSIKDIGCYRITRNIDGIKLKLTKFSNDTQKHYVFEIEINDGKIIKIVSTEVVYEGAKYVESTIYLNSIIFTFNSRLIFAIKEIEQLLNEIETN